jgi:hypothetical protein
MSARVLAVLLSFLLVDFLTLTGFVVYTYGPIGCFTQLTESWLTILLTMDVAIALSFASYWLWSDAKARGRNPWPYLALTATTGSAGPLAYAITLLWNHDPHQASAPTA